MAFVQIQKQPPEVFCKKRYSQKFCEIYRETSMPESLFNKVAGLRPATLFKRRLWHRCFPLGDCFYRFPMSYRKETFIIFYDFSVKAYQSFIQGVEQDRMVCFMYCFFFIFNTILNCFPMLLQKLFDFFFSLYLHAHKNI